MVPSHEVFQTPFKVDLRFDDHAVPSNYRLWPGGENLGSTIKVWKVQTKSFPEIDPGLVSDPYGFADSPDAEVIASGLNSKGPDSVTLGRHGNFFLWGFSASPSDMTPEARKCFVNAVCYIKKFDGQKPLVRRSHEDRQWAFIYMGYIDQVGDSDRFLNQLFPENLRKRFGKDKARYVAYYRENLEYLRPASPGYDVDEDVRSLGLSNRKVQLLDKCVAMLEQGDRPDLARRILTRYTTVSFADAKGWRSWLDANRDRLFFTDVGDFKFMVAPDSLVRTTSRSDAEATPKEPDARHPVVATAELKPAMVQAGETLELVIRVKTAPTWHIYAVGGSNGPGIPTSLKVTLPKGVVVEGEWACPEPIKGTDGQMIHEGSFEFRHRLRVDADAKRGPMEVACELGYEACDPSACRPPARITLKAQAEVGPAKPGR